MKPQTIQALLIGSLILAIAATAYYIFAPHDTYAMVTGAHWSRTMSLEKRSTESGEGWGSRPDAFNVACHSKYYGEERCHPRSCNGHMTFSPCGKNSMCPHYVYDTCWDSCSVYKDWCNYNYYQWNVTAIATTSGGFCDAWTPVAWPVRAGWPVCSNAGICPAAGDELTRNEQVEDLSVRFSTMNIESQHQCASAAEFCQYQFTQQFHAQENHAGQFWLGERVYK